MPYVKKEMRELMDEKGTRPLVPGPLNYRITTVIRDYLTDRGTTYNTMNDIIGALESAKLEFYRRIVAPYEDHKITENGDVYP